MNPHPQKKIAQAAAYLPDSGPLCDANRGFHNVYNRLVDEALAELGDSIPVLVMIGDDLTLLVEKRSQTERIIPDHYHRIKALAHTGFGMQLWLMARCNQPLDDALHRQLEEKQVELLASLEGLSSLPSEERGAPRTLLQMSQVVVGEVLQAGRVDAEHAHGYAREIAPLVFAMAAAAVRLELDRLHAVVCRWRNELGEPRWQVAYVVLCDNHQPRYRHAARQYFGRLFNEQEGIGAEFENRILFGESVQELDRALDLAARHLIDQRASQLIFGDASRLQQDLLADAAAEYLDELLPARGDEARRGKAKGH